MTDEFPTGLWIPDSDIEADEQDPISGIQSAYSGPESGNMKKVLQIALGVIIGVGAIAVACSALLSEGIDEVERENQEKAITAKQFKAIKTGMARKTVLAKLGEPDNSQTMESEDFESNCDYWPVKGGELLDRYQVCYDGKKKVESKAKY